ncbi:hypothetical protein QJS10_CPA06g00279 [Acorus calamus]|uniref:Uncharacterized protein n=1 Tax=Acorus calamus TaxID=4465 RepID=A0AAV9ENL8_ACOCL|nr:hypothetical protein QJS10_CPA06g00279 [Acorus calamus]
MVVSIPSSLPISTTSSVRRRPSMRRPRVHVPVRHQIRRQIIQRQRRRVRQPPTTSNSRRRRPTTTTHLPPTTTSRLLLPAVLNRQPLIRRIRKRRCHHKRRPRRDKRPNNTPPDHLPLTPGEVHGEPCGSRRCWAGQKSPGQRQNLKPPMQCHYGPRRRRLTKRDVGDGARSAHDADAALAPPGEGGDAVGDVGAAGDLHDVAAEGVGAVARHEDRGFGFVLGSRGTPAGAAGGGAAAAGFDDRALAWVVGASLSGSAVVVAVVGGVVVVFGGWVGLV